jgi:glycine/D-amino acid oxidase-like deaminating enzyme
MRTDDLQGGIWLPGDGKANPADLCMSLAKGARNRGVKMVEGVRGHRRDHRGRPGAPWACARRAG